MRDEQSADLVVIGSGVAGLSAALAAANAGGRVSLLTAGVLGSGSSPRAQGGVAASVGADDAPALHAADTLAVGAGLNDRSAVHVLVEDGRTALRTLVADGVPFDQGQNGPDLGLEAGHGRRRILRAAGGATGHVLTSALLDEVTDHPGIDVSTQTEAESLVCEGHRVTGVSSRGRMFLGRSVVLATGGYAGLWMRTTNSSESRGSGLMLAWSAGASLTDLEFVQFHPTALLLPGLPAYLLTEALRGEGALVVDEQGRQIADPLMPRDSLAREIARFRRERGPVYLSLRQLDSTDVRHRFSTLARRLEDWDLDLARDFLPIAPAAHYCMGGVRTDTEGRTGVPGLYAAGEVACTGAQGANRLASNSLLECLVFGARAARAALQDHHGVEEHRADGWKTAPLESISGFPRGRVVECAGGNLGESLDHCLGVERDAEGLADLLTSLPDPDAGAAPPDHWLAATVARAALLRRESRGAHFRRDAPVSRDRWRGRIHFRRGYVPQFEEVSPL